MKLKIVFSLNQVSFGVKQKIELVGFCLSGAVQQKAGDEICFGRPTIDLTIRSDRRQINQISFTPRSFALINRALRQSCWPGL